MVYFVLLGCSPDCQGGGLGVLTWLLWSEEYLWWEGGDQANKKVLSFLRASGVKFCYCTLPSRVMSSCEHLNHASDIHYTAVRSRYLFQIWVVVWHIWFAYGCSVLVQNLCQDICFFCFSNAYYDASHLKCYFYWIIFFGEIYFLVIFVATVIIISLTSYKLNYVWR